MARGVLDERAQVLSAGFLRKVRTKSFRNRNWWRLSLAERALFKSAIRLAELRGYVANRRLTEALGCLVDQLLETASDRIVELGYERAQQMARNFTERGLSTWLAILMSNISNTDYIFCLGLGCINLSAAGVSPL